MQHTSRRLEEHGLKISEVVHTSPVIVVYSVIPCDAAVAQPWRCVVFHSDHSVRATEILQLMSDPNYRGLKLRKNFIEDGQYYLIIDSNSSQPLSSYSIRSTSDQVLIHKAILENLQLLMRYNIRMPAITGQQILVQEDTGNDEIQISLEPWAHLLSSGSSLPEGQVAPELASDPYFPALSPVQTAIFSAAVVLPVQVNSSSHNQVTDAAVDADDLSYYQLVLARMQRLDPRKRYSSFAAAIHDLDQSLLGVAQAQRLLGEKDDFTEPAYESRLVGRDKAIEKVWTAYRLARDGMGSVHAIAGSAGVGKTRLVGYLTEKVRKDCHAYLRIKFPHYESQIPLAVITSSLETYFRDLFASSSPAVVAEWHQQLARKPGFNQTILGKYLPGLAGYLPNCSAPGKQLPKVMEQENLYAGLASLLATLCVGTGVSVLVFENIQYADPSSLDLIAELNRRSNRGELGHNLILLTYRPEFAETNSKLRYSVLEKIPLDKDSRLLPFTENEVSRLIAKTLPLELSTAVEEINKFVFAKSSGNPGHVIKLLNRIASEHLVTGSVDHRQIDRSALYSSKLKADLAGLIARDFSELSDASQKLLMIVAVTDSHEPAFLKSCLPHIVSKQATPKSYSGQQILDVALAELRYQNILNKGQLDLFDISAEIYEFIKNQTADRIRKVISRQYLTRLCAILKDADDPKPTAILFAASRHINLVDPEIDRNLAIHILIDCAKIGQQLGSLRYARSCLKQVCQVVPLTLEQEVSTYFQLSFEQIIGIYESYADILGATEEVDRSLQLYYQILEQTEETNTVGRVLQKIAGLRLCQYEYQQSLSASERSLEILNYRLYQSELLSIVLLPYVLLKCLSTIVVGLVLPKKKASASDEAVLSTVLKSIVPTYLTKPLCSIANLFSLYSRMGRVDTNKHKAILQAYLGAVLASVGCFNLGRRLVQRSRSYFHSEQEPEFEVFLNFSEGYMIEFPAGRFNQALTLLNAANAKAVAIGEVFWRTLCYQARIEMQSYTGDIDEKENVEMLLQEYAKINFGDILFQCAMRYWFQIGDHEKLEHHSRLCAKHYQNGIQSNHLTLDLIYYLVSQAEIDFDQGKYAQAIVRLKEAHLISLKHFHYAGKVRQIPILLCECYLAQNKYLRSLPYFFIAILFTLFGHSIIAPRVWNIFGYLVSFYFNKAAGFAIRERAIVKAYRQKQWLTATNLRLLLAKTYSRHPSKADHAATHLECARRFYDRIGYQYNIKQCLAIKDEIYTSGAIYNETLQDDRVLTVADRYRIKALTSSSKEELFEEIFAATSEFLPLHSAFIIATTDSGSYFEQALGLSKDLPDFRLGDCDFFESNSYRFLNSKIRSIWLSPEATVQAKSFQNEDLDTIARIGSTESQIYYIYLRSEVKPDPTRLHLFMSTIANDLSKRLQELLLSRNFAKRKAQFEVEKAALQSQIGELNAIRDSLASSLGTLCFTFDSSGAIISEISPTVASYFPDISCSSNISELLDPDIKTQFQIDLFLNYCIDADVDNFAANTHHLPRRLVIFKDTLSEKHLEIFWIPIVSRGEIGSALCIMNDVTHLRSQNQAIESLQRGRHQIEDLCLVNQQFFKSFLEEAIFICNEILRLLESSNLEQNKSRIDTLIHLLFDDSRISGLMHFSQMIRNFLRQSPDLGEARTKDFVVHMLSWLNSYSRLSHHYRGILIDFDHNATRSSQKIMDVLYQLKSQVTDDDGARSLHDLTSYLRDQRSASAERLISEICQAEKNSENIKVLIDGNSTVQDFLDILSRSELISIKTVGRTILKLLHFHSPLVSIEVKTASNELHFQLSVTENFTALKRDNESAPVSLLRALDSGAAFTGKYKKHYQRLVDLLEVFEDRGLSIYSGAARADSEPLIFVIVSKVAAASGSSLSRDSA